MLYTDNIGLKKPAYSDPADIADINENSDIIDREFGNRYLKSETYSVEQANNAIAQAIEALPNGLVYRGAVNYYKDLPTDNNELGDTYSVKYQGETGTTADGNEYAWGEYDGTLQWIKLGVNAYTKNEIDEQHEVIKSDILKAENDIAVNRTTLGTQCKNILKNTSTTVEYKGITYTINADGSITANGATGSETSYFSFKEYFEISKPAKYTLSGCPSGGSQSTWELQLYKQKQGSNDVLTLDDYGAGVDKFNTKELDAGMYRGYIAIRPNQTIDNLTFYPMLRYADITDDTYEPYKSSLQEQINALVAEIAELKSQITTE